MSGTQQPGAPNSDLIIDEPLASLLDGFDPVNNLEHQGLLQQLIIPASVDLTRDTDWKKHWDEILTQDLKIVPAQRRDVDPNAVVPRA